MRYLLILLLNTIIVMRMSAHGGEDHAPKASQATSGAKYFSVSAYSEKYEVLLRYEPLKGGQKANLKLFVSDYRTNKPIKGARIALSDLSGASLQFTVKPLEPGIYSVETAFPENKSYTLAANISGSNGADLMTLDKVEVGKELPKSTAETEHESEATSLSKILLYAAAAFAGGVLLTWLILRRNRKNA